jgi:hypothetical protein
MRARDHNAAISFGASTRLDLGTEIGFKFFDGIQACVLIREAEMRIEDRKDVGALSYICAE